MTHAEIRDLQRSLNTFTKRHLKYMPPIRVDGDKGRATNKRIRLCKFYLGYVSKRSTGNVGHEFRVRLRHPNETNRWADEAAVRRGQKRRIAQRRHAQRTHLKSYLKPGVTRFEGVAVAKCAVPVLKWCRAHGWRGHLVSGYRDPKYSQHLCYAMCGHPTCPGRCAGLNSNHVGNGPARFAIDVSDYVAFRRIVAQCPLRPHIKNSLPADRVHFSPNGQ